MPAKPKHNLKVHHVVSRQKMQLLVIVALFTIVGIVWLLLTSASGFTASSETETATISAPAAVVTDAAASGGQAIQFGSGNTSVSKIRGAFYYPWFPEAWSQAGFNPFTNYHPSLGFYSSTDSTVINTHIDELIYAGMNSAIFSWWGQGSKEDNRFASFLSATGSKPLKWALYYECEGNSSGGTCGSIGGPAPAAASIQSDLSYIRTKYANDSHYLYFNGKPVVFVYGDSTDSCTTASNWKTANTNLGSPFYIVLKVFSGYATCANQPDNWHQYGPASPEDIQAGRSIAISPGFWKKGHPLGGGDGFPFLARDLTRWQQNVTDLKNSTNPIQVVTTFNEWGEGSSIESATEWASASNYGSYVDVLHNTLVGNTTPDTTPPTVPGNFAASLPVSTGKTVHLAWTASTDSGGSGLQGYVITRNGTVIASPSATATSYDDTTTLFSTSYNYGIVAKDKAANTSTAASVSITTPAAPADTQAPDVPTATASVVSPTQVTISWNTVADNPKTGGNSGVKGYRIFRDGSQIADILAPSTSTNDGPFSFVSGQTYHYTVLAYDVNGNASAQSAQSNVVPNPVVTGGNFCGNTATGNSIDTVIVIAEENKSWSSVGGVGFGTSMPYSKSVAAQCAYFSTMTETEVNPQNSATQYVGAWTGFGSGVTHVNQDCSPTPTCSYSGNNIFRVFRNAGIPHREYVEGATTTCSAGGNAAKHIPELYMWDPTDKANCNAEVLPLSQFNFAAPPTGYTFITPDLCNDGHDCSVTTVDNWLSNSSRLPALFNTAAYKSGRVLVELWWDEDKPKPNLFACWSCKHVNSATAADYAGDSLLWLNLLGAPSGNLGAISANPLDFRPIIGTP